MRPSRARLSAPDPSYRVPWSASCITNTFESEFSVHTGQDQALENTMSNSAHAYLVESIPKGLEDLRGTPGVAYTEDVLVRLTSNAKSSIDLTAMYWALLADPG